MLCFIIFDTIVTLLLLFVIFILIFKIYPEKVTEIQLELLSVMINTKDMYTQSHDEHVGVLCNLIYNQLPQKTKSLVDKDKLIKAAKLHDVGKILIPDDIIGKPDKLNDDEYEIIKLHAQNGAKILERTSYKDIAPLVALHHEREDGTGYYEVSGEQIPIEAKIIAIADTFSSITTDRVYRKGKSISQARKIIKECAGTQLSEHLVDCFLQISIDKLVAVDTMLKGQYYTCDK